MRYKFFVTGAFFTLIATAHSNAQQQNSTAASQAKASANTSQQAPKNNLGQQVNAAPTKQSASSPPQVVLPTADEVLEKTIGDIEDMQLTPEQIEKLKKIYLTREKQKISPYISPAKPITRTLFINLDPGVSSPVLRLTRGLQTSIVFSDASGQPWFIKDVSLNRQLFCDAHQCGGASAGAQQQEKNTPTNILTIEPLTPAAYGNVTVTMNGMATPIIFILTTAQNEVDMRVDAKVPGLNPDSAETVTSIKSMPTIDNAITNFLDGVPPKSAKTLKVSGMEGVEAWVYQNYLYVKTKADAQYPAYISAARSSNGVSVYRFENQHSSVTFLSGGQAVTAFFE